jgi:hypothetical protein
MAAASGGEAASDGEEATSDGEGTEEQKEKGTVGHIWLAPGVHIGWCGCGCVGGA